MRIATLALTLLLPLAIAAPQSPEWTATVTNVQDVTKTGSVSAVVSVRYTDGTRVLNEEYVYRGGDASIQDIVSTKLLQLHEIDRTLSGLTVGERIEPIQKVAITVPPVPSDPDRETFKVALRKLQQLQNAKDSGVIDADNKDLNDQIALVRSLYKSEYIDLF